MGGFCSLSVFQSHFWGVQIFFKNPSRIYFVPFLFSVFSNFIHLCKCTKPWTYQLVFPVSFSLMWVWLLTHLSVEQRVVVPPHLWVNIVEVPLEAFTLQTLPQRNPLRDVSIIDTVVLQEHSESLEEVFASQRLFFPHL